MRQIKYYTDACIYINLVYKSEGDYFLTKEGLDLINTKNKVSRNALLSKICLKVPSIKNSYINYKKNKFFDKEYIKNQIITFQGNKYSNSTLNRRATTVISWIKFITININE